MARAWQSLGAMVADGRLVIRGGEVIDGSGAPAYRADVAIVGERIVEVGNLDPAGDTVIEASGMVVCPGFIDVHTHDDLALLTDPLMDFKLMQGVTTDIVGNCGWGPAPHSAIGPMIAVMGANTPDGDWK